MELGLPTLLQASVLPLLLLGGSRELSSHVWEPAWPSLGGGLSQGPRALRATWLPHLEEQPSLPHGSEAGLSIIIITYMYWIRWIPSPV